MTKREFTDKDHGVMQKYYDICERDSRDIRSVKTEMMKLIQEDPNFLDSYLYVCEILHSEGKYSEEEKLLDEAYSRAISVITDRQGNWPDVLEWGWLENRHIIRTLINKGVSLWNKGKTEDALEFFRKILKSNPGDNGGVRYFILAIRMGMTYKEYEKRFDRGGYYNMDIVNWFDENFSKFPDEFDWLKKSSRKVPGS